MAAQKQKRSKAGDRGSGSCGEQPFPPFRLGVSRWRKGGGLGLDGLRRVLLDHNLGARAHLRNQHLASLSDGTDRNSESIAAARQGDDVTLSFKRVAERLAQLEDVLAQVGFLDERVRPDLL